MSETRNEQALHNRAERLRPRIDAIVKRGLLTESEIAEIQQRVDHTYKAVGDFAQKPAEAESQVAQLEVYVSHLEVPPNLSQEQADKADVASKWMFWLSLLTWLVLMATNLLSILINPAKYPWPFGWFNSFLFVGFALAGVSINILLTLVPRLMRGDWDRKYLGIYMFRVLQATVYSAVIFHFVKELPVNADACPELAGVKSNCLTRESFPFGVTGIFVGLFVNLLEGAFAGIGERFVDMISTLFASKFAGPTQKAEKNRELRQTLIQLRTRYAEMDKTGIATARREEIESGLRDALLLLQGNENERAEEKLQEVELKLASAAQPALELTNVEPREGMQGETVKDVLLEGQGFQKNTTVRLQKDSSSIDGTDVKVISQTRLQCTFVLAEDAVVGMWDVVVVDPSLKEYVLAAYFEVKAPATTPTASPSDPGAGGQG